MRIKKNIILIMFFILIPIILADIIRNIPDWNCPSGLNVLLTHRSGAINSYGVEETLGQDWNIAGNSHTYTLKDPNTNDRIKKIAFFGIPPTEQILYTLKIPPGSYSISGYYVLDSHGQKHTGTTNFVVRENTCIVGTEEDLDGDNYGRGCACAGSDCCDSGTESSLRCSVVNAPNMNPGEQEDNTFGEYDNIDQDCNGCDYKDTDNDGYTDENYLGFNGKICGNDCDDNNAAINPGATEIQCDEINNNCLVEACSTNGDCCPSTDENDLSYYDTDCDCVVDICSPDLIMKYLSGQIDPPFLKIIIDAIPLCGYSNPP